MGERGSWGKGAGSWEWGEGFSVGKQLRSQNQIYPMIRSTMAGDTNWRSATKRVITPHQNMSTPKQRTVHNTPNKRTVFCTAYEL